MSTDQRHRSRAFLYGESVFTTLRVERGRAYFQAAHQKRLIESAEWLWPGTASEAQKLWDELSIPGDDGVWRITLYAEQAARGVRLTETPKLDIDSWWTPELPVEQKWQARLVTAPSRPSDWPSFLKSGDYLARLVSARHLSRDEIPLFQVNGWVTEFLHANVFVFDGKNLITPPTSADVLAGIGRARLMNLGVPVIERPISVDELSQFAGIVAVNAVRGIMPLTSIDGRSLQRHAIFEQLQKAFFA